jgi:serine/threonine-protein kinase HSL1 (negative regulator of Swe1 kinase)
LLKYRARRLEDYDEERDATKIKEKLVEKRMLPPPLVTAPAPVAPIASEPPINPQMPPANVKVPESAVVKTCAPLSETTTGPLRLNQPAGPRPLPGLVSIPTAKNRTSLDTPITQVQGATLAETTTIPDQPPPVPAKNIPPPLKLVPRSPLPSPIISSTPATESPGLPPIEVPDLGDPNMQRFFRQIVEHLNVMQPRSSIATSDDGRSGVSSMGNGSERMSAQHSHGGTSGYSSQVEDDGDASRFADADEYYALDMEGYTSSTGGGSIRSPVTSRAPRNLARNGVGSNRHSYHQPPLPPPKNETVRGGTVSGRLQSLRPSPPPLRGSPYGSPYHQNLYTPLQSRALSNRASAHSPPLSAPPIPGRHRSYPVQGSYVSDKENSIPPRATLSAGVAPRPSLKNVHSDGAGTIERRKSYGKKHVQIVLPGEEAKLKKKKSFSSEYPYFWWYQTKPDTPLFLAIGSSDDSPFFVAPMEKRSWFGNLFKFRPASYHLLSVYDFTTSRDECRRLLMGLGVRVTVENTGYLRCRLDEFRGMYQRRSTVGFTDRASLLDPSGVMAVTNAVRFRVEMHAVGHAHTVAGFTTSVIMIQEKGALSTFKLLYNRLRRDWELDAPPPPILLKTPSNPESSLPSPTFTASPGGRSPILPEIY